MLWVLISTEAILMSTHNICLYGGIEENDPLIIIKYPPIFSTDVYSNTHSFKTIEQT